MTKPLYAQDTAVPVERSRAEIERVANKHGATSFASARNRDGATVMFDVDGRRVRFDIPTPSYTVDPDNLPHGWRSMSEARRAEYVRAQTEKETRRRWRALGLIIKAKLEAVASGVVSFESEFLAQLLLPGGSTVGNHVIPQIAAGGKPALPPMLGKGGGPRRLTA